MKVFNPINSKSFSEIVDLLNCQKGQYLTAGDINKVNGSTTNIFLKKDDNKYVPLVSGKLPIVVTTLEKYWLKHVLTDPKSKLFLSEETFDKLTERLRDVPDIIVNNLVIKNKGKKDSKITEKLTPIIKLILQAIEGEKGIIYNYLNKKGEEIKGKTGIPLKIEYSVKDDIFYLIYYSVEEKKIVKGILANFTIIKTIDLPEDFLTQGKRCFEEFVKNNIKKVTLEVYKANNGIERTFYLFSCFKRKSQYIKEEDRYILTIYYYFYEEMEVIHRILSLGKSVKVLSPGYIQGEVVKRIKKALEKYS